MEQNYVFEVLAREGHRVDKVLVLTTKTASTNPKSANAVDSSDALIVHPPSARCRNPRPRPNLATPRQQRDQAGTTTSPSKTSSNPVAAPPSANPSSSNRVAPARRRCERLQSTGHRSHSLFRNIGTGRDGTSGPLKNDPRLSTCGRPPASPPPNPEAPASAGRRCVRPLGQFGYHRGQQLFTGGAGSGELHFQRVHQGHQLLHLGHDPALFGEGWEWDWQALQCRLKLFFEDPCHHFASRGV